MSTLSGSFAEGIPGLPRGRGRLEDDEVLAAQRPRILRAAIAAFSEKGFAATTIADIVGRARVSRHAFYKQFDGKETCFLAAVRSGIKAVLPRVTLAGDLGEAMGLGPRVHAVVHEYLQVCAAEPEFTRAWTLEFPQAGAGALLQRNAYFTTLALGLRELHVGMRAGRSETPTALPESTYLALIGGCHELFYRYVADNRCADLPDLEKPMAAFLLTVLR